MKALNIKSLIKTYGDNEVLRNIDFQVKKGDFCALLGYNGAGKTTIIGILTDLVRKNAGKVEVFGVDIDKNFAKAKKCIGVVPQEFNFSIFQKVKDIPVTQAGFYGVPKKIAIERTEKYLKILGLWDKRDSQARELSGGMKRRLMIVRALIHEPKLLILDEPTAGVDVELRQSTWDFIQSLNKSGMTILLTTHYLDEVEALCNRVVILNKGKIIEDTTTNALLNKLDGEEIILDVEVSPHPNPQSPHPNPLPRGEGTGNSVGVTSLPLGEIEGGLGFKVEGFFLEGTGKNDIIKKYKIKIASKKELEIYLSKDHNITDLISDLDKNNIKVNSFRNKRGRLEQLFIKLMK